MRVFLTSPTLLPNNLQTILGYIPEKKQATLRHYGLFRVRNTRYPALIRDFHSMTHGALVDLPFQDVQRLDEYYNVRGELNIRYGLTVYLNNDQLLPEIAEAHVFQNPRRVNIHEPWTSLIPIESNNEIKSIFR